MKNTEDLVWRSKSHKRNELIVLFFVSLVELFSASFVSSVIGVILVFLNPDARVMRFMNVVSFIAFGCINILFWVKYARQRAKRVEFYIVNGLVYAVYFLLSVGLYRYAGQLMYSIICSNLRGMEIFGASTIVSLAISHGIIICLMILCETFSREYFRKVLEKLEQNGAEKVEMDMWGDDGPIIQNEEIRTVSLEEMYSVMEAEQLESARNIDKIMNEENDDIWDKTMYKGRGEAVEYIETENPDRDIDEKDYVFTNEIDERLWNEEIYKGAKPIDDYADETDEYEKCFVFDEEDEEVSLWDKSMQKGKGEKINEFYEEDTAKYFDENNMNDDRLWADDMYQGRRKKRVHKSNIDRILKNDAIDEAVDRTPMGDYDSDNLWDGDIGGKTYFEDEEEEEKLNTFEKYDSDNLWDAVKQGKK